MHKRGGARRRRILPFDPPGWGGKAHTISDNKEVIIVLL